MRTRQTGRGRKEFVHETHAPPPLPNSAGGEEATAGSLVMPPVAADAAGGGGGAGRSFDAHSGIHGGCSVVIPASSDNAATAATLEKVKLKNTTTFEAQTCAVCFEVERPPGFALPGDEIVKCRSGCGLRVHRRCYGFHGGSTTATTNSDLGDTSGVVDNSNASGAAADCGSSKGERKHKNMKVFECDCCKLAAKAAAGQQQVDFSCVLCGKNEGARKQTTCGRMVHPLCCLFHPGLVKIDDLRKMNGISIDEAALKKANVLLRHKARQQGVTASRRRRRTQQQDDGGAGDEGDEATDTAGEDEDEEQDAIIADERGGGASSSSSSSPASCLFCGTSCGALLSCEARGCGMRMHPYCARSRDSATEAPNSVLLRVSPWTEEESSAVEKEHKEANAETGSSSAADDGSLRKALTSSEEYLDFEKNVAKVRVPTLLFSPSLLHRVSARARARVCVSVRIRMRVCSQRGDRGSSCQSSIVLCAHSYVV
eukprot:GHVU01021463.1.p1 GENE.GHVU01021463.1~~GHVU01021463.1.p1  ORF type:complete len:485 (-),score=55.38 GHVU01021463.1:450-1904(-)